MTTSTTIDCEAALRLLALYIDGELQSAEHASVEQHLLRCRSCYSRHEFEHRLKTELSQLGRVNVRPEFEQQIRQLITQFTGSPVRETADD